MQASVWYGNQKKNLIIKKYSCQKPLDWFKYNLAEIFLWWPKIALAIMIHHKIMATRGRDLFSPYIYIENFKNLLVIHHWTHFSVIWQKCFFSDFQPSYSSHKKKWPPGGAGLINPIYLYKKSLNSSCQKPLDRFQYNLEEMFLWWPSTKIVQVIMIHNKHDCQWGGAYFPYISLWKTLKIFLSETTGPKCSFGDPLLRLFKPAWFSKNMAIRGQGLLSLYVCVEN